MTDEYRLKVEAYLKALPHGALREVKRLAKDETRADFLKVVKDFIATGAADRLAFEILFTADYEAIYKFMNGKPRRLQTPYKLNADGTTREEA